MAAGGARLPRAARLGPASAPLRRLAAMVEAAAAPSGGASAAGAEWATLREGQAEVLHKPGEAFYNKAQVQNRDLSIAVIREFIKLRERDAQARAESGKGGGRCSAEPVAAGRAIFTDLGALQER